MSLKTSKQIEFTGGATGVKMVLDWNPVTKTLSFINNGATVAAFDDAGLSTSLGFSNTGLKVMDTGGDHEISIVPAGDEAADRTLSIPLLGGADTIETLGTAQTVTGVKTFSAAPVMSAHPINNAGRSAQFVLYEDFYGTWAIGDAGPADTWSTTAGAGTGNAAAVTVANGINGEVTIKSASDDGTHAQNNSMLTGIGLPFKASQGGLIMEARLKIDAITNVFMFVGFTDTISTTVECPIFLNAADLDSDATDACGVIFDTDGTTAQFCHGGVKNGTDTTPAYSGGAPTAATYVVIRVEVDSTGAVRGYINGTAIGAAVANAVTTSVALTPCIVIGNRGAAQRVMTLDYIFAAQNR